MKKKKESQVSQADMPKAAEKTILKKTDHKKKGSEPQSPEDSSRLLHELEVHQVELEMQNDELRRARAELEALHARYLDLYDLAPVGYLSLSEKGVINESNLTFSMLLGVTRDKLLKSFLTHYIMKEDRNIYYKLKRELLETGGPRSCELRLLKNDGSIFWTLVEAVSTRNENGATEYRMVISDITERKHAELELVSAQLDLKEAHHIAHIGIWDWQAITDTVNWTREMYNIFGIDPSLPPPSFAEHQRFLTPASWESLRNGVKIALDTGEPYNLELELTCPDGSLRWVNSFGGVKHDEKKNIIGLHGTVHDITERKLREKDLLQTQERLSLAQRSAGAGVWDWDMTTGILNWSTEFFSLFGLDPARAEASFDTWRSALHPEDISTAETNINEAIRDKKPLYNEYRIILPKGDVRWISAHGNTFYDPQGKPMRMSGICIDITERKEAEQKLQQTQSIFKELFDTVPSGVAIYEVRNDGLFGKDYIIKDFNRMSLMIEGCQKQDVIGKSFYDLRPEIDQYGLIPVFRKVWKTGIPDYYPQKIYIDEKFTSYYENRVFRLPNGDIAAVYNDVTEHRQAEMALESLHQDLKEAHHLAHIGTWDWTIKTDTVTWSEELYDIAGIDPLLPPPTYAEHPRIYTPESWEKLSVAVTRAMDTGEPYNLELEMIRPDGSLRWINAFGGVKHDEKKNIIGLHGTVQDITERVLAEAQIRESELRFRQMFEKHDAIMLLIEPQTGLIIDANKAAAKFYGYEKSRLCMMSINDINTLPPEQVAEERSKALNEDRNYFVFTHRLANGTERIVEVHSSPISINEKQVLFSVIHDITERRQAEDIIQITSTKYKTLFDNFPLGITVSDESGNILESNQAAERILGVSQDLHRSLTIDDTKWRIIRPDGTLMPSDEFASVRALKEKRLVENIEMGIVNPDNQITWISVTSAPLPLEGYGVVVTYGDITERKSAEEALQESEQKFLKVLHSSRDAILLIDGDNFVDCNEIAARMLEYDSRDELLKKHPSELSPPTQPDGRSSFEKANEMMSAALNSGSHQFEWVHRRADGVGIPIEVTLTSIAIKGKNMLHCVWHDITKRRQAEEEKAKIESQLLQAQKMESVGRLAGGVAHDFNNMLAVIIGHTELALMKVGPNQAHHSNLLEIHLAAERSANLTRQLLAFARKQTAEPKVLDLNDSVKSTLSMIHKLIGEDIELNWLPGSEIWPVMIDPSQVDQVLANLCINARDAINGVGTITIETGNTSLDDAHCAAHLEIVPGEYVRLSVSDSGCGMEKETLANIFEPFFTTKEMGRGTGLGLATVYGIVKQNKGHIDVYSEPGQGTTFNIYLPRYEGGQDYVKKETGDEYAPVGHETILLVEDEIAILNMTTMMLMHLGYTVLAASSPGEAIHLAEQYASDKIHMLITDVIMPGMNGQALARTLLSQYPHIKSLFMSGYTPDVIAGHGVMDEGMNFIRKPFSIKDLATKIREVLDK